MVQGALQRYIELLQDIQSFARTEKDPKCVDFIIGPFTDQQHPLVIWATFYNRLLDCLNAYWLKSCRKMRLLEFRFMEVGQKVFSAPPHGLGGPRGDR